MSMHVSLYIGERASGKSTAAADALQREHMHPRNGIAQVALVGSSMMSAIDIMSPMICDRYEPTGANRGTNTIQWARAHAHLFGANDIKRMRGCQFSAAWVDDLELMSNAQDVIDQLRMSLRLGDEPHLFVTATQPRGCGAAYPPGWAAVMNLLEEPGLEEVRVFKRMGSD